MRALAQSITGLEAGSLVVEGLVTERISLAALPGRFAQLVTEPTGGKVTVVP